MFKNCWNSISFYYWFHLYAQEPSCCCLCFKAVFSETSTVKSSWILRVGKVKSSVLHGICQKPGILWIIGPLIKTNFVFGSVRTSTTATQPCGIINIGTFNMHELFWILQCNHTKNNESTIFHPKCSYRQVFYAKLGIAVHEWIWEMLSRVDPHAIYSRPSVFPRYIWCKLSEWLKYSKYQLTKN